MLHRSRFEKIDTKSSLRSVKYNVYVRRIAFQAEIGWDDLYQVYRYNQRRRKVLEIKMNGESLKEHCAQRASFHEKEYEELKQQRAKLGERRGPDSYEIEHAFSAKNKFAFYVRALNPAETYHLSHEDCLALELWKEEQE